MKERLNIDKFGEIMDKFLKENPVQMVITLPEGTLEPTITDNTGLGVTVQMHILAHSVRKAVDEMWEITEGGEKLLDPDKKDSFVEATLEIIKSAILNGNRSDS